MTEIEKVANDVMNRKDIQFVTKKNCIDALNRLKPELIGGDKREYFCYTQSAPIMRRDEELILCVIDKCFDETTLVIRPHKYSYDIVCSKCNEILEYECDENTSIADNVGYKYCPYCGRRIKQ